MNDKSKAGAQAIFPTHIHLALEHNEHHAYYQPVKELVVDHGLLDCFTPGDLQRAIDTDELWVLQWYPDTPVGFHVVAGSTLEIVLARAQEVANER